MVVVAAHTQGCANPGLYGATPLALMVVVAAHTQGCANPGLYDTTPLALMVVVAAHTQGCPHLWVVLREPVNAEGVLS